MYPAYTQLVAKRSSPSICDARATGCILLSKKDIIQRNKKTWEKILKSEQVKIRRTIPHIASSHPLKGKKRPQNTQTTVIFAPFFLSYFLFFTPCFPLQILLHKKNANLWHFDFTALKNYFRRMQVFFAASAQCWPKYKIIPTKRGSAVTITVGFVGLMVSI